MIMTMPKKVSNGKNEPNVVIRNPGYTPGRTIKRYKLIDQRKEEAIIKFYDELAPESRNITIDVEMLVTKAFPAFKETLGETNWNKIAQYFGIEDGVSSKKIRYDEVSMLISKIRTIENAQYYLYGFSELLEKYAVKLSKVPEGMTTIEKAKVVRMFLLFFSQYYFFAEDFVFPIGSATPRIDYAKASAVNKKKVTPEEMFYLYRACVQKYSDGSFLCDAIIEEVKLFNKRIKKEILEVAELKFEGENIVSVNVSPLNCTFGYVRGIKKKMFCRIGYFPMEMYVVKDLWKTLEFGELYDIYKKVKLNELSKFKLNMRKMPYIEGSRILEKEFEFRIVAPNVEFSCEEEANRYIRFVEYLANCNVTMPIELMNEQNQKMVEQVEIGKFFAFLQFAYATNYLTQNSSCSDEYSMYRTLLKYDSEGKVFDAYMKNDISDEEMKLRLGIDHKFEEDVLGILHTGTLLETVKRFAVERGIVENEVEISDELVNNVLIPGNEKTWERYSKRELSELKLREKLGLNQDIIEMYFVISKIDIELIEQKLLSLKSRRVSLKEMKKNALTINLYCYIVEEKIACGPKGKIPKGNKRLKPENLKKILG